MFDLVKVCDFYQMVLDDFDDFMDEPHSARRVLHCAISAYHVYDWVWADWVKNDETQRAKLGDRQEQGPVPHLAGSAVRLVCDP